MYCHGAPWLRRHCYLQRDVAAHILSTFILLQSPFLSSIKTSDIYLPAHILKHRYLDKGLVMSDQKTLSPRTGHKRMTQHPAAQPAYCRIGIAAFLLAEVVKPSYWSAGLAEYCC